MFGSQIKHIKAPRFPQFRFEWHPVSKKVYVVHITGEQEHAAVVAEAIDTHAGAQMAILIWLRGYRVGSIPVIGATPIE